VEPARYVSAIGAGERIFSALLLIALSPALLVIAITIYVISGRSPLIGDCRVARYGRRFWMLKLRTMWPRGGYRPRRFHWTEYLESESRGPKVVDDPRVTSGFAAFCRRHSIDELPQLWHVIDGTMSYVGPRPLTSGELEQHYGDDTWEVLAAKPGLSGLWQVLGRSRLSYRQRKRLDLRLVRHESFGLYLAILRRTVIGVLRGKSAW
jgi:exopolysaccharide production protein ExoY